MDKEWRSILISAKNRDESLSLQSLETGLVRLDNTHPLSPTLLEKYSAKQAGIGGEERVADIFRKHSFTMEHRIFHDVTLFSSTHFQMDSLLLTPSFALIFEAKNIGGRLKFIDDPPQLIRTRADGQIDGYDSPAAQVERNVELLGDWLQARRIQLPIIGVVVLAYPKQIVEQAPAKTKILFPNLIPQYIKTLSKYPPKLDKEKLDWLTTEIIKNHQFYIPKPLCEIYRISKYDIRTGVMCPMCKSLGMNRVKRTWHCPNCGKYNKSAHEQAIKEWFLLFGGTMKNSDCREFLHIENKDTATRILRDMNLLVEGKYRNRTYRMDFTRI